MRLALGLSYQGGAYQGWQSQPSGRTVQDKLESALSALACEPISTLCAGRTDAGVHALMQVVHFDTRAERRTISWVRGTNARLPDDIAVHWAHAVPDAFHCRAAARSRRYAYVLQQAPVRPALDRGRIGWVIRPLDGEAMNAAAAHLIGEHDFSAFRAAQCQALSPRKRVMHIGITRRGSYWRFDFEATAFLHHMVRNIMGCLIAVGEGRRPSGWMRDVLDSRSRDAAAPTFAPDGLYFLGPRYEDRWGLPERSDAYDALP